MADSRTLLEHLALTCTNQRENVANDALCHILSSSESARLALQEMLRDGGAEVGSLARVSSQVDLGQKIPDLEAFDEHGERRVLIEGKFWAELTKNQPVEYLKALPKNEPTALLFVAPSSRSESLWPELRERVRKAKNIDWQAEMKTSDMKSAAAGGTRRLMLTSWKALLSRMEAYAQDADDEQTKASLRQLRGLTDRMDTDVFLPLKPDELGPECARRLLGLNRLIDDATQRAREEGWLKRLTAASWPDGYGRGVSLGGTELRLAISSDLWVDHPVTPLWLRFASNVDEMRRKLGPVLLEQERLLRAAGGFGHDHPVRHPPRTLEAARRFATVAYCPQTGQLDGPRSAPAARIRPRQRRRLDSERTDQAARGRRGRQGARRGGPPTQ